MYSMNMLWLSNTERWKTMIFKILVILILICIFNEIRDIREGRK